MAYSACIWVGFRVEGVPKIRVPLNIRWRNIFYNQKGLRILGTTHVMPTKLPRPSREGLLEEPHKLESASHGNM